jgi:hypothetical protein
MPHGSQSFIVNKTVGGLCQIAKSYFIVPCLLSRKTGEKIAIVGEMIGVFPLSDIVFWLVYGAMVGLPAYVL